MQAEPLGGASSQPVAIKALSLRGLRGDWKALELFQREANTLEALQHPGIPKYLEYFEVDTPRDKGFYLVQVKLQQGKDVVGSAINGVLQKCCAKRTFHASALDTSDMLTCNPRCLSILASAFHPAGAAPQGRP